MGVIARRRIKEDLHKVEVFLTDTTNEYFAVQDIPDTFVQGRSSFKIFGSQFLKHGIPLKIEILDRAGKTVYIQPVKYGQGLSPQLQFTYISVEVYRHNASGEAQLTILGSLDETKVPFNIPERFRGAYNVKWQKTINLNKAAIKNTQPILFYKSPSVTTQEVVKAEKKADPPSNKYIRGKQIYGKVKVDLLGQRFNTGSDVNTQTGESGGDDGTGGASDKSETSMADVLAELNLWKYKTGEYGKNSLLAKKGIVEEQVFSEPPQMTIYSNKPDAFNTKMVGGTVNVRNIQLTDGQKQTLSGLSPSDVAIAITQDEINERFSQVGDSESIPDFTARIENVISDTELTVTKPYSVDFRTLGSDKSIKIYSDIGLQYYTNPNDASSGVYADFTASYVDWSVPTTSSYRFFSYIDMKVRNMRTFSGDVYRLKIYGASDGNQGDFPVLLDTIVESPELLVDTGSASGVLRSGYLQNLGHINKYWNSYGGDGTDAKLNPAFTMSLADGAYLSGSYSDYNESGRFETKKAYAFTIKKDIPYTLSFKAIGKKTTKTTVNGDSYKDAKLYVHISGSNLSDDSGLTIPISSSFGHPVTNELNKPVGLQVVSGSNTPDTQKWGPVSYTFTPKFKLDRVKNEDTVLQFRIESGNWSISDISLKPGMDTGFSPDEMEIRLPIPWPTKRPDNFDFLIEYYDVDGRMAEPYTFINNVQVSGSELVMEGTDNLLTGSLYVGNIQGAGIEFAGKNSAYMRSIGYEGFISASAGEGGGFMIWSGSVLPDSPDNYSGSGIEIHDGRTGDDESYFKFRTIDADVGGASSFDVKTSRFFFGKAGQFISGANGNITISSSAFFLGDRATAFVSGANGNLEISSSNFHVSGGVISASAGHLGNWSIEDGTLKGENITMDAANSTIYKTDQGPGSDSGAAFDRLRDEYYIDFSPEVENPDNFYIKMGPMFMVDKDGILVASGAVFHGSITASAGYIGGFQIGSASIYSTQGGGTTATPDFFISGSARPQVLPFDKGNLFISASGFQVTSRGAISASDGNIGGWTLGKNRLLSPNNRLTMSALPGKEYFGVTNASGQERVRIGEISAATDEYYGIKIFDGTAGDNDDGIGQVVLLGDLGNKIGGWEITGTQIRSIPAAGLGGAYDFAGGEEGLILQSNVTESRIETAGFVSGLRGFRMSSAGNGTAEFENMSIRGTLRTTVFEKESVNVVGGQLMVANSTTIQALKSASVVLAGSSSVSATDVSMSVANASGFSRGEILMLKSVDDLGFSKEYVYVTGSKRWSEDPTMAYLTASEGTASSGELKPPLDPDGIAGEIYVGRAYGSTGPDQINTTWTHGYTSGSIGLASSGDNPTLGAVDTIFVNSSGSLSVQDIIVIDEEKMKITAITGSGANKTPTKASASLTVIRDFHDTVQSVHNTATQVTLHNPDMQFLAGLVSTARPYTEGQVVVSTGKYAQGTDWNGRFDYQNNVATVDSIGDYKITSGSTHLTTSNKKDADTLVIFESGSDGTGHDSLYSLFGKGSYIVLLVDSPYSSTSEWYRYRVSGNPSYTGAEGSKIHTFPIKLNQTFYDLGGNKDTADEAVEFWFMSNIQDVSSGYIMLNANPNDPYSPYMDFVERTGPDVYDLALRTRIGDLSGLSSAYLYGDEEPGFGIYTENGFFRGTLHAMTGSIHGVLHVATSAGGIETGQRISIGRQVSGDNDGIFVNAHNYWYTTGAWKVGGATNYLSLDSATAGNIDIKSATFDLDATSLIMDSAGDGGTGTIRLGGSGGPNSPTADTVGIYMDGGGALNVYGSATNYFRIDGAGSLTIKSDTFDLDATTIIMDSGTNNGKFALGASPPTAYNSGNGVYFDGTGKGLIGSSTGSRVQFDGTTLTMSSSKFLLGDASTYLSGSNGNLKIKSEVFDLGSSTVSMSSADSGKIMMGTNIPSSSGQDGIWLSGSGHFSFQSSSAAYIRSDADGFAMNFPSFSIDTAGRMTANEGTFKGHLEASTGFFGSSSNDGWNISANTISDSDNVIQIDATKGSENITITSQSFFAEMVPDFTAASVILSGGGNSHSGSTTIGNLTAASMASNGVFTAGSTGNVDTDTEDLSNGETLANPLALFGGFTVSPGPGGHTSVGTAVTDPTDATLSGGDKVYKSTATVVVAAAVVSSNYTSNSTLNGLLSISGSLALHKSSDDSVVATTGINSSILLDWVETSAATTKVSRTISATFNHTVATDTTDYYIKVSGIKVTNNGITEAWTIGPKSFTTACDITGTAIYFTEMSHQPSNKKVEIAPGGIQAVFLRNSTLEHDDNKYFRVAPDEDKTVDMLGSVFVTGSLAIKSVSSDNETLLGAGTIIVDSYVNSAGYIKAAIGTSNGYRIGNSAEIAYDSGGTAGIEFCSGDTSTLDMVLTTGGALHTRDDITAFSTTVTSDKRFKTNIVPLENGLSIVKQLQGVEFDWDKEYAEKGHDIGFIAQDVQKVDKLKSLVKSSFNIRTEDDALSVSYEKITTVLVEAIKEQQKQIDELKQKLEEL